MLYMKTEVTFWIAYVLWGHRAWQHPGFWLYGTLFRQIKFNCKYYFVKLV
jgi:hypothetical protein